LNEYNKTYTYRGVLRPLYVIISLAIEFGSERIPRSLLRGKRANDERYCSLRIEDSPQQAAESFNTNQLRTFFILE